MKVLVTGSSGFIGKNLCLHLQQYNHEVLAYDLDSKIPLKQLVEQAEFVIHLAGINRPLNPEEFYQGNLGFTSELIALLEENPKPILLSSSTQASLDNDYGKSKKLAEDVVLDYGARKQVDVFIYRLSNVFGKWCKPNYNSVIATWCHNIHRDIELVVNDPNKEIEFIHIDDLCASFIGYLTKKADHQIQTVTPSYTRSLGYIQKQLQQFKHMKENLMLMGFEDDFVKKLYATYLSYLPEDQFSYPVKTHADHRGSFTELIKTKDFGQMSVNIIKPGITKGNHYHHLKNEKFIVVKGSCEICFRHVLKEEIIRYVVSDKQIEVVDIPCGYTHNIRNIGVEDAVVLMWANECFDPNHPDTYFIEV